MTIESKSLKCNIPSNNSYFTNFALDMYDNFNKAKFNEEFTTPFVETANVIYSAFSQKGKIIKENADEKRFNDNGTILLAFSGGLDSVYQALRLKETGKKVVLFHVKNMNFYTNGQEYKAAKIFAEYKNFDFVEASVTPIKNSEYKKVWKENPAKNELFFCMMLDYILENGGNKFSSGDDLNLTLKNAVPDTNLSDAKEVTLSFMNEIKGVEFIPIPKVNKADRIKYLAENNCLDYYYSCVTAGRLVRYLHDKAEQKFNIKLDYWDCGAACRKCAFHSLLKHYYLEEEFPDEYINKCWDTISKGADNVFFDKSIPLEQRIKNLIEY